MCVSVHVCVLHIYTYILSTDNISQHGVSAPQRLPLPIPRAAFPNDACINAHIRIVHTYLTHTHAKYECAKHFLKRSSSGFVCQGDSHCHSLWHCECRAEQVNDTKS